MTDQATETTIDPISDAEMQSAFEREFFGGEPAPAAVEEAQSAEADTDEQAAPETLEAEAEDEDEGESESSPDEGAKPKRGIEKRFSELTNEIKELRAQLAEAKAGKQEAPKPAEPEAREPNPDDYDGGRFDPEYMQAVREWDLKQVEAKLEAKLAEREQQRQQAEAAKAVDAAEKAFAAENKDYGKVKAKLLEDETVASSEALAAVVMELPVSERPGFIHYLGKHLDEARQIAGLGHVQAIAKAYAIAEKLQAKPEPKPASKAPKPIRPLSGGGGNAIGTANIFQSGLSDGDLLRRIGSDPNYFRR